MGDFGPTFYFWSFSSQTDHRLKRVGKGQGRKGWGGVFDISINENSSAVQVIGMVLGRQLLLLLHAHMYIPSITRKGGTGERVAYHQRHINSRGTWKMQIRTQRKVESNPPILTPFPSQQNQTRPSHVKINPEGLYTFIPIKPHQTPENGETCKCIHFIDSFMHS